MKHWQRNTLRCIVTLVAIVLLLPMVVYFPPLQRVLCRYAEEWVSENTPVKLSVASFSLRYPLRVGLHDVVVISQTDTLFEAVDLYADVALLPLLGKNIVVRDVELGDVSLDFVSPDSSMSLQAVVGCLSLKGGDVELQNHKVNLNKISLDEAQISMIYNAQPDTGVDEKEPIDWDIEVDKIHLSEVDFAMYMPPLLDTLQVVIPHAHVDKSVVLLARQDVAVQHISIDRGDYRYIARYNSPSVETDDLQYDSIENQPWSVRVGKVSLNDNRVAYITSDTIPMSGIDFNHVIADNIDLSVSDVYNCGGVVELTIDNMSMQERSGLSVEDTKGVFAMNDTGKISLTDFALHTPYSSIQADAEVDMSVMEQNPDAQISINADAQLSCRDIVYIYPQASQFFIHDKDSVNKVKDVFTVQIDVDGTARDAEVKKLQLAQSGVFSFDGSGDISMPFDERNRRVALSCQLNTTENLSLANYISDTVMCRSIEVHPIDLHCDTRLSGSNINVEASVKSQGGVVDVHAIYDMQQETYEVSTDVRNLPIDRFMPHSPMGLLSANIQASGQYLSLDNQDLLLDAHLLIDTLEYQKYLYRDIDLSAHIEEQHWAAKALSGQSDLHLNVAMEGEFQKDFLSARVNADIGKIDLTALHFAEQPFDVSAGIRAEVVLSNVDSIVQADVEINNLNLGYDEHRYQTSSIGMIAASDITYSYIDLYTDDLDVNLSSDVGLKQLRPGMERLTQFVDTIIQKQRLNMDELHRGLPPFEFVAEMGMDNVVQRYLNSKGMRLGKVQCSVTNDTLFNIDADVRRFELSGVVVDTITFVAHEKNERLNYRLAMGNRPGNMDEFAHVRIEGFLSGNSTRLYCLQHNRKEQIGFLFGCKVDFEPDCVRLAFGPQEPIIGYKKWLLNGDNYLTYIHSRRDLEADVKLSYENSHLFITTEDRPNKEVEGVHIDMQDIELSDWVVVSSLVTPMSGLLSANVYVDMPQKGMEINGTLDVVDYVFNHQRVGTFHADVDYNIADNGGSDIKATILHDGNNILDVMACLDKQTTQHVDGSITIKELPMGVANAFFPQNMGELTGKLNSHLTLKGTLANPAINGFIRFDDASTTFQKIGASLSLDNTEIPIVNSVMTFNQYGIKGANNVPLNINGTVDMSRLTDIGMNLNFKADNFQPIHIAENRTSIIYGDVYTDVEARVKGTLNNLNVRGRVSLLSGTNATYVMQSNKSLSSVDYSEMVSFVSFTDTISMIDSEKESKRRANMIANVDIEIDEGVQLGINLSPDGNNRIDLVGGGNLLYTSTALGDNRMTGRYVLTGGFVRYTPPFISQKIFNIEDGSYVSWNGNIAEPTFNITGVQSQRSTVKSGEESRLVDFEVSIKISNTLKDLDISFDLSTTDDMMIENELQSLSPEQREVKAMNMFLYNSYDDLVSAAQNSMINNPLNTFLEYELNTWAQRTLRGVDLTFGIDNYGIDGTGTQRTDYSYQFSKSLLDNRLKVVIGGSYASNQDVTQNLKENLIDDISLEYRITKRDNMYVKVFRQTGYESIVEGEITQTGVGFLFRKQVGSLLDIFRKKPKEGNTQVPTQPTDSVVVAQPVEELVIEEESR